MTAESRAEFYSSGHADIERVIDRAERCLGPWRTPDRALDFGCGVGRLALAMTRYAKTVVGYDIAPGMLQIAQSSAEGQVCFTGDWPESGFDWINSYMVFQHIAPARGESLLAELLKLLQTDGVISLHFTIYRDAELQIKTSFLGGLRASIRQALGLTFQPPVGSVSMFDYDMGKLLKIFHHAGIDDLALFHVDHDGHHGVQVIGRKR